MSRYHTEKDQDGRAIRFGKGYSKVTKAKKRAEAEARAIPLHDQEIENV